MDKFVILESKITGQREVVDTKSVGKNLLNDPAAYEVCGYGPTRQSCLASLLWLEPSKYKFVVKDPYDNEILVGSRVAYNYQGEVRIGYVLEVALVRHNGKLINTDSKEPYLIISVRETQDGKISKVSKRKNLVVIN